MKNINNKIDTSHIGRRKFEPTTYVLRRDLMNEFGEPQCLIFVLVQ